MPTRVTHGHEYIEPPKLEELPRGVPSELQEAAAAELREGNGRIPPGAKVVPSLGGLAQKGRTQLSHRIAGEKLSSTSLSRARTLRNALTAELARSVGGGRCGVAASLMIKFASQKTAAAEEAFQRGDYETHRKLSESARMDVLYAREHASKEAIARLAHQPVQTAHEALSTALTVTK